jgi:hypothetical protein
VGIIYSPARSSGGNSGNGVVSLSSGVGSKTPKFCALQDAMYKMTTNAPVALFTLSAVINGTVNCTPCTSIDFNTGACGPSVDARKCDDGVECTVPAGGTPSNYKCPMDTSVGNCNLCNSTVYTGKTVSCTYSYTNGTTNESSFQMSNLNSDSYADVLGGIPRPDKCCLEDANGNLYTYTKKAYSSPLNVPLTFSSNGDPTVDCGLGSTDSNTISQLSSFCNIKIPIKTYDINCSIS